ncbi:hypothetical protein SESBI_49577 [Sesbania bispinosa]|nr:hypothetical protein SESBI_49577 [Sesbania bispinosa]
MINQKVETEGSYSNYDVISQSVFGAEESVSSQPERTGRLESKEEKMKKVRKFRASNPIEMEDGSPNYMKATSSSHAKDGFQKIKLETCEDLNKNVHFQVKEFFHGERPLMSQSPDSSLHKATCSSTLKDSHFIDLPQDGSDSQVVPAMKVVHIVTALFMAIATAICLH